jgi:RNA polymerase sigma-70 factor (ECF subfamily)
MTEPTDGAIVRRVLSGDREAFGVLVDRHQDAMMAYARYMGFGDAEASDVVQEAFVRAFRHLRRCGEPARFGGWLFRIVSNLSRTELRRNGRRATEPLEPYREVIATELSGPDERLEAGRRRELVRRALDKLPPDQREAIVLMYLQGRSVSEIEELTGASKSAVKMRLKRGREAMKAELEPLLIEVEA